MAVSIISVDVQDEAFREFQELFAKHKRQVEALPGDWGKVGAAAGAATETAAKDTKSVADAWKKFKVSVNPFSGVAKGFKEIQQLSAKAKTTQEKFQVAAIGGGRIFGGMAKATKSVAVNLTTATMQLLKWGSLTGVFSGLIGAGGLFGIARLAQGAANSRRESQGLGVTPAEHEAAKINYQKFIDVDAVLARINEARADVTKRWAFPAAGISPGSMEGKSNADVLKMLIPLLKSTNEKAGGTMQGAQAHGLLEFVDMDALTRLKAVQQEEITAATQSYDKDKRALAVGDQTMASWQQLNAQLARAGTSVENLFITKLASLAGPIGNLSDAFTNAVRVFLDSPKIGQWIDELAKGIDRFSKYMKSEDLKGDIASFLDAVDEFAGALSSAAKALGKLFPLGSSEKTLKLSEYRKLDELGKTSPALANAMRWRMENPVAAAAAKDSSGPFSFGKTEELDARPSRYSKLAEEATKGKDGKAIAELIRSLGQDPRHVSTQDAHGFIKTTPVPLPPGVKLEKSPNVVKFEGAAKAPSTQSASGKIDYSARPDMAPPVKSDPTPAPVPSATVIKFEKAAKPNGQYRAPDYFRKLEDDNMLPRGMLAGVEKQESGGDTNAVGPVTKTGERARGSFQFMKETAKQYGVDDPTNRRQAADGAARYLHDMMEKFKGSVDKVLAGYNWGQGNVDKMGMEKAPSETRDYIAKVKGSMDGTPRDPRDNIREAVQQAVAIDRSVSNVTNNAGNTSITNIAAARTRVAQASPQTIMITNATGGNAVVQVNQAAQ